jgi:hypothetical protein
LQDGDGCGGGGVKEDGYVCLAWFGMVWSGWGVAALAACRCRSDTLTYLALYSHSALNRTAADECRR